MKYQAWKTVNSYTASFNSLSYFLKVGDLHIVIEQLKFVKMNMKSHCLKRIHTHVCVPILNVIFIQSLMCGPDDDFSVRLKHIVYVIVINTGRQF